MPAKMAAREMPRFGLQKQSKTTAAGSEPQDIQMRWNTYGVFDEGSGLFQ